VAIICYDENTISFTLEALKNVFRSRSLTCYVNVVVIGLLEVQSSSDEVIFREPMIYHEMPSKKARL
jgi:hypothetical protein